MVTDKGLIALHLLDPLFAKLDEVGIAYVVFDGAAPESYDPLH